MKKSTEKIIARLKNAPKRRILFVCLGNICRSPAAEGVLADIVARNNDTDRWNIDSAGTGRYHIGELPDRRMRIHARHRGIELTHRCRQVSATDFDDFDLIIAMEADNEANLRRIAPTADDLDKIVPMAEFVDMAMAADHIPDPYYSGADGFELVLDLLENGCSRLYNILTRE